VVSGCADFNATTMAIFEVKAPDQVTLIADDVGKPTAVFDSDGDGAIEVFSTALFDDGIGRYIVTGNSGIVSERSLDVPNNDCGC
jgi:hypothetical protein